MWSDLSVSFVRFEGSRRSFERFLFGPGNFDFGLFSVQTLGAAAAAYNIIANGERSDTAYPIRRERRPFLVPKCFCLGLVIPCMETGCKRLRDLSLRGTAEKSHCGMWRKFFSRFLFARAKKGLF